MLHENVSKKMATTNVNMEKLVILNRFEKGIGLLPLVFYAPFGIVLTVIRCFVFFHALLIFYFLSNISFVHNVVLRVMFMVCGLMVTTDGAVYTDRPCLVMVANHMTSLDPFILNLVMKYVLVVEPSWGCSSLIQLCRQVTISGHLSKEERAQFIKTTAQESKAPLLFFPEGRRANSSYGLLKFRVLPFECDTAIQPVGIIARRWFFNINVSTFTSPWWMDLLISFFIPFTVFNIKYLPLTERRESENSQQFSERVQSNLARGVSAVATGITLADIKEFVKPGQQTASAFTAAPNEFLTPAANEQTASTSAEPKDSTPEAEVTSSDPEVNMMLKQVKEVLPYVSSQAVLQDLEKTRDVDATITNILESRVDLESKKSEPQPVSPQKEADASTFKASSFPRVASERHLSLQERKQAMLEEARRRYKEKHGIP